MLRRVQFPIGEEGKRLRIAKIVETIFQFFFFSQRKSVILDGIIDYRDRIERVDFYQGFNFFEFRVERIVNFPFTLHRSRGAISTVS